jgi:hypothetical protein
LEEFCVIDFPFGLRRTRAVVVLLVASALLIGAATALAANIQGDGTLVGSTGNANINAGNGKDQIWGLGGMDSINAGNGNDTIDGNGKCSMPIPPGDYPNGNPRTVYCEHGPIPGNGNGDNINAGNRTTRSTAAVATTRSTSAQVVTRSTAARSATPSTPKVKAMTPSTSALVVVTR